MARKINQQDNDWFFDHFDNQADKILNSPGKSMVKLGLIALVINVLWFLFVVAVIAGAVLLVLSLV